MDPNTYPAGRLWKDQNQGHRDQSEQDLECNREAELRFAIDIAHAVVCIGTYVVSTWRLKKKKLPNISNESYGICHLVHPRNVLPIQYETITPKIVMASSIERPLPRRAGFISSECHTAARQSMFVLPSYANLLLPQTYE